MDYYKINYNKLDNLKIFKFSIFIFIIIILFVSLLILSFIINIDKKVSFYGIVNNNIIEIKVNKELSDILTKNHSLLIDDEKTSFKIYEYGEYEIINDEIYQIIYLTLDKMFIDKRVVNITINYNKQKIFYYILDLFK